MYDYIVVGGGSSGSVIASRLSDIPEAKVLMLEAGPKDWNPYIHIPVGFYKLTSGPLTWGYKTTPQIHLNNREIPYAQGRVLGGGGSINAEVYTRGAKEDYDNWADNAGCSGWSYEEVLPYFIKSEGNDSIAGKYHGTNGPLGVSNPINPNVLSKTFVQACQQFGMPYNYDFNGEAQEGCGLYQTTTRDGKRCSAAEGYLSNKREKDNLTIIPNSTASKILVENGRAVGVEYLHKGKLIQAKSQQEVIITSGAIGSPKLLMLSGIGASEELNNLGIDVVSDIPGVGKNLQDHIGTDIIYSLTGNYSLDKYSKPHWAVWAALEYMLFRKGPIASNVVEGGAFWYADTNSNIPDTQIHFLAGAGVEEGVPSIPTGSGLTMNTYFTRPRSRGTVSLKDSNLMSEPNIDPNYLDDPYDVKMSVEGVKIMREIMNQKVFSKYVKAAHLPDENVKTDKDYENFIREYGRTCYHPVGTCKMGIDDMAVVDPELRVKGVDGLRVADSSIMPSLVGSNTNAPSIMIGEKASDLIKKANN